jgi:ribosomal protein S18 acetylase RimI-like enzyme
MSPIALSDADRAYATLAAALVTDQFERWLYPEDDDYAEHFPAFIAAIGERSFSMGSAWQVNDFGAVALSLPPGTESDAERIGSVLRETVVVDKHADMFAVLERMDAAHPHFPHWYLPLIAVNPNRRGEGLGDQLMTAYLAHADLNGIPVYVDTSNPDTIPFYERHGFVVTGDAQVGSCPPLTFLLRDGVNHE